MSGFLQNQEHFICVHTKACEVLDGPSALKRTDIMLKRDDLVSFVLQVYQLKLHCRYFLTHPRNAKEICKTMLIC
jgi:hypothetical protein